MAIPVSVLEGYERWAATYDQDPNPLLAREERFLLPLIAASKGQHILDVACGTGRWLRRFTHRSAAFGIDRSSAMLQVARHKSAAQSRVTQGTLDQMPFRDGAFDLAICSFALAHVCDLAPTAAELARVLRSGSDLFVSDLHPEAIAHGWRVGFRIQGSALEIEARAHPTATIAQSFCAQGFVCQEEQSLWLGDAERPIFECSGKSNYFKEACGVPAVIVFHFRRNDLSRNHHFPHEGHS